VGICQRKAIHGGDAELLPERRCSRRVHYRPELSRVATDDELLDALHVRSEKSRLDGLGAFVENENVRLEEVLLAQLVTMEDVAAKTIVSRQVRSMTLLLT
jgi:hypothetical protein